MKFYSPLIMGVFVSVSTLVQAQNTMHKSLVSAGTKASYMHQTIGSNLSLEKLNATFYELSNLKRGKSLLVHKSLEQASFHHNDYMVKTQVYSHHEKDLKYPSDRVKHYMPKQNLVDNNSYLIDEICFKKKISIKNKTYSDLAMEIIDGYNLSESHKEILFSKTHNYIGSSFVLENKNGNVILYHTAILISNYLYY